MMSFAASPSITRDCPTRLTWSNVEALASISVFLATLAAGFITVIERILELAIGQVTLYWAGRLDMFFISFVMVRNGNYSVNYKQYAFPANCTQVRPFLSAATEGCA